MSDPTAQEPTMEEILASIRRIISEDDGPAPQHPAPAAVEAPKAPAPALQPVAAASPPPVVHDDEVLELTEPAPPAAETHGDLDVFAAEPPPPPVVHAPPAADVEVHEPAAPAAPAPEPAPVEAAKPHPEAPLIGALDRRIDDEPLLSGGPEDRAASHFGLLSQSIAMPPSDLTLEDVVRQLLRPLLKDWLDHNLPEIVAEKVQAEVERIARRRV